MIMICEVADKCYNTICLHKKPHDNCGGLSCFRTVDNKWPHVCIPVPSPILIDVDELFDEFEI